MLIAKILLLAFDEKEEEIIDAVMSVIDDFGIDTQLKAVNSNPKLLFHGLYIDEHKRICKFRFTGVRISLETV